MRKTTVVSVLLFVCSLASPLLAGESLIINAFNRSAKGLNGEWKYIVDPYENGFYNYRYQAFDELESPGAGAYFTNSKPRNKSDLIEYDFDTSESISVPGDWSSQKERLFYYEGTVWYKKSFDHLKKDESNRVFLYFGAANYQADVYFNGKKLGRHIGGFTPFNFEITKLLREKENFLIVKVDNKRKREGVPTLNTDWWNYGGITRDVILVETPSTFVRDYLIQLDPGNAEYISGHIKLDNTKPNRSKVLLKIPEMGLEKEIAVSTDGSGSFRIKPKNLQLWSPDNPKLYDIEIIIPDETIKDTIGFRTVKTSGKEILLNGEPIFLRGISIHEENPVRGGRANSLEDAKLLLGWAKELGCNYVRLAHYPHNENMIRLADQLGLMVWEEIPVYWTIDWENAATYENAQNQLEEVIARDKNRAAVIIWSMANETPVSVSRNRFLESLAKKTRELDPTRLISAALEQRSVGENPDERTIEDPFAKTVDILSFNQYIGWYDGLPEKARKIRWIISQNKPVIISEFGAGAKYGFHADKATRWSEEYQESLYIETLKMIEKIDQLRGLSPWILADFRSPRRHLPKIQDGWNRKGLLSETGQKKLAFFVLRDYYQKKARQQ